MTPTEPRHTGPLAYVRIASTIVDLDVLIARLDGAENLLTKAGTAVRRGDPGDRDRAHALIDRAEGLLPEASSIPVTHREALVVAHETVVELRRQAQDLPA